MNPKKMKTKTKEQQVGGNHYELLKVEPVKVFVAFNFNWFQAEILKYTSRFLNKNGEQDLEKAIHISQMALDLKVGNRSKAKFVKIVGSNSNLKELIEDFTEQFEYKEFVAMILIGIIEQRYDSVKSCVKKLKEKYYGKKENPINRR